MEQKKCRICGEVKDIIFFVKCKSMKDGYRNDCKKCSNKKFNDTEKVRNRNLKKEIKNEGIKACRVCDQEKPLDDYHIKRGTPDGHRQECKECVKEILKKYKELPDFKEKQKEYDKQRYDLLRDQILERKKQYHIENREEILEKKKDYRKIEEYKINYKLWREENKERLSYLQSEYRKRYPYVIAWRTILHSTLKRLGTPKEGRTIEMLGYSALDLKQHLEKQFVEDMTWENHGEWHIDHIKAVANFDSDADIREVCSLDNLQPLWAFDNLSKNKY
jgi:hypothetical protein